MLKDNLGHPVDPVDRLRSRSGLVPLGATAEQSARQAPPHLRENYDSSDAAASAYALARRVVETADLICRGVSHG